MAEAKTVKKRSVGRPKKNKALQQLRVQTWFNAVAEASGKTAYELEKEFAPSTVDRENFNKQRARLWEKYRLGKTMPTIKEKKGGRQGIARLVEEKYPGTIKWLESPIWELLNTTIPLSMDHLLNIYCSLDNEIQSLLIESRPQSGFWKKSRTNIQVTLDTLIKLNTEASLLAVVCLWRESMICQQYSEYIFIKNFLRKSTKSLIRHPRLGLAFQYLISQFVLASA